MLCILGTFLALSGACGKRSNTSTVSNQDMLTIVALDRSGSTENFRKNQIGFVSERMRYTSEMGTDFYLWTVDRQSVPRVGPGVVDYDTLDTKKVVADLQTPPAKESVGTRPALFWEEMTLRYGGDQPSSGDRPVVIFFLSDGGNDYRADEARITRAVKSLSKNPHVKFAAVGVNPELRTDIESLLSPFGSRARVFGRDSSTDEATRWIKGE